MSLGRSWKEAGWCLSPAQHLGEGTQCVVGREAPSPGQPCLVLRAKTRQEVRVPAAPPASGNHVGRETEVRPLWHPVQGGVGIAGNREGVAAESACPHISSRGPVQQAGWLLGLHPE